MSNTKDTSFVVWHDYSDHSGGAEIIYVGTDKAAAFDALMECDGCWSLSEIYINKGK